MTSLDSSSAAESSMDDDGSNGHHRLETLSKANSFNTAAKNNRHASGGGGFRTNGFREQGNDEVGEKLAEEGDNEVWGTFSENFRQVQSVLDRNSVLIQQVNENHQSKIPDNLVKNVALIQEINGNISKVVSLYSDLSVNLSSMFRQGNGAVDAQNNSGKGDAALT